MPSTYSNLKIQLMATGENNTTWGNVTNVNLGTALEEAIAGSADVAFSNANVTLTLTDTNAAQTARNMRLNLTGTATAGYNLVVPAIEKPYIVNNGTDGTITVKNTTGTGIAVPAGKTMWVFNNGTNVVDVVTHLSSVTLGSALPVASGGTGTATALTAGSVVFAGASGVYSQDNANLFWDNANDRLGIGTTSPTSRLTVTGGDAEIRDGNYLTLRPVGNGWDMRLQATGTQLDVLSGGALGSPIMSLLNGGNVGIGTATPAQRLHVRQDQNGTTAALIQNRNGSGTPVSAVQFISGTFDLSDNRYAMISSAGGSNTTLQFWTGEGVTPTEKMRIASNGNVMVGTTSATGLFSVAGVSYGQMIATDRFGVLGNNLYYGTGNFRYIGNGHAYGWTQGNTDGADLRLLYAGNNTSGAGAVATTSERIYITAAGNVGIGTSTPEASLDVNGGQVTRGDASGYVYFAPKIGTTPFGANYDRFEIRVDPSTQVTYLGNVHGGTGAARALAFLAGTNERMRIDTAGNVGIGTTSPGAKLDVVSGAGTDTIIRSIAGNAAYMVLQGTSFFNFNAVQSYDSSSNLQWAVGGNGTANTLSFLTNGANERMRIDSSGKVGIGTASPAVSLDVVGGIRARGGAPGALGVNNNGYSFDANGDTDGGMFSSADGQVEFYSNALERMRITNAGDVGIGNASPGAKLDITGNIRLSAASPNIEFNSGGAMVYGPAGNTLAFATGGGPGAPVERFRIASAGQLGIGGTNYGTSGQVLTSQGASSPPIWSTASSGVTSVSGTGSANGLSLSGTVTSTGNITLSGSVTSVAAAATIDGVTIGYRSIPRSTTSGTAVVGDVGKCIAVTAGITIPNSTFAAGDAVSIYNDSGSAITITAGVTTLRLAGTTTTGNRTLAVRGLATIWFNSATEAVISGAGVS